MTTILNVKTFEVRKDNWAEVRVHRETLSTDLQPNEVLLKIDRQALTANNISYATAGDSLHYWAFFPTEAGWGRIPGMGWSEVIASAHLQVQIGERVWGFTPYSTHHKILAGHTNSFSFSDVSPHRAGHAPIYCQFDRAAANPLYEPAREDQDSLLRGLYMTSWLVEDFLELHQQFNATSCLITSASSKTSIALAHAVKQRGKLRSIGITSSANVAFCEALGCYDDVISYSQLERLDGTAPAVMVDMAGNAKVISQIHHHYGNNLQHSCRIGATHYTEMVPSQDLPGPAPQFFFAPTHVRSRGAEIGVPALLAALGASYGAFRQFCDSWMTVTHSQGESALLATYQSVLAGTADPIAGQIVSL